MNVMYDSRIRKLLDSAKRQGFRLEHAKKCFKLYPPDVCMNTITVSCTPSDTNYFWQLRRQMRKCGYIENLPSE